jgi:hypothetical protein
MKKTKEKTKNLEKSQVVSSNDIIKLEDEIEEMQKELALVRKLKANTLQEN